MAESRAAKSRKASLRAAALIAKEKEAEQAELTRLKREQKKAFEQEVAELTKGLVVACRNDITDAERGGKFSSRTNITSFRRRFHSNVELPQKYDQLGYRAIGNSFTRVIKDVKAELGADGYAVKLSQESQGYEDDGMPLMRFFYYLDVSWF